jgi:ATP phosphoribosyltransferase regulatory subunit
MHAWLLPEYIEDVLPPEAERVECIRRRLLDLFRVHGYELVIPPLIEYLPALLTGSGHDLALKTFTLVDQLSGRAMGLRADITPQAARIDAHLLNRAGVVRLCYAGSVLHTLPTGQPRNREPLQIGAELFGHAGLESDVEIQRLMLRALRSLGIERVHLDLGHVAIFRSLVAAASVPQELESALFQALQGKDAGTLEYLTRAFPAALRAAFAALPTLYGGEEVLDAAARALPDSAAIRAALQDLRTLARHTRGEGVDVCFDLAELRGYHYHSGAVFAVYTQEHAHAVALGGRYDDVGEVFGRRRPATGFSMDLRVLAGLTRMEAPMPPIHAPALDEPALLARIEELRAAGEAVALDLGGEEIRQGARRLVFKDGDWRVESA